MEMKAIHAFGPGDLRVVKVPVPVPADDQVLIRVRASGICGSDKWVWYVKGRTTKVAGHEVAGEVVLAGKNVTALSEGDRVIVNNVVGCGKCPACCGGAFVLCEFWNGSMDVNNGYGEYVAAPALLKTRHAFVVGVDPVEFRRKHALTMGADRVFSPDSNIVEQINEIGEGIGGHFVVECSGHTKAYETGLSLLRIGGMFVTVGEEAKYTLMPSENVLRRSLTIQGTWYSTMTQGRHT